MQVVRRLITRTLLQVPHALLARLARVGPTREHNGSIVIVEITTHGERQVFGVVVDSMNAVLDISASEVEPPPAFSARIRTGPLTLAAGVDGQGLVKIPGQSQICCMHSSRNRRGR